jgi:glycosyltransferase involved in cell wall biosynthesis
VRFTVPEWAEREVFDDFRSAKFGLDHALASIARGRRRTRSVTTFLRKCDTAPRKFPHGLPRDLLPFNPEPKGGYLAFLGRISPEKRPDRAIDIALRAGMPLKIAAKIDRVDQAYWTEAIAPKIAAHESVEFIGEINERQKAEFLGNARALLFPIDWPEPFGLVMIEAMACGTPVVAFRSGSTPEVIDDGVTGFVVDSIDQAVEAVLQAKALNRAGVRATFERRFTAERMARDYLAIYRGLPGVSTNAAWLPRVVGSDDDLQAVA